MTLLPGLFISRYSAHIRLAEKTLIANDLSTFLCKKTNTEKD